MLKGAENANINSPVADYGSISSTTSLKCDDNNTIPIKPPFDDHVTKTQSKPPILSPKPSKSAFVDFFTCDPDKLHMHCAAISGILPEYGNTVGDSLIVPYLLELGAPTWSTSYVWVITPFIDSWMQPIYGKLSDKYTSRKNACCKCGGRKPFIILFGLFATIGLIVIPQARLIEIGGHMTLAVIVCILSYTLMDMSHGDLLIPTRALLNDLCHDSKLMKYGNEKFTFYQAIGRCLGYFVVSINWKHVFMRDTPKFAAFLNELGLNHQTSICFTLSILILWTIIFFVILSTPYQIERLQSPKVMDAHNLSVQYTPYHKRIKSISRSKKTISNEMLITPSGRVLILHPTVLITETISSILSTEHSLPFESTDSEPSSSFQLSPHSDDSQGHIVHDLVDSILSPVNEKREKSKKDVVYNYNFKQVQDETPSPKKKQKEKERKKPKLWKKEEDVIMDDVEQHVEGWKFPNHFKLLWIIQFLGWGNFAAFSLYFTSFVAIDLFNGLPNASTSNEQFENFETGIRVATTILLISAIIAALSGKLVIPYLNNHIGVKLVFFVGELVLSVLLVMLLFSNDIVFVIIIVCLYGVAIQIHYNNVFIIVEKDLRELFKSEHKRAYVLSIFNLSILFANVLVSILAGWIVHLFNNQFVWGISFFAIVALFGDIIVYIVFFVTERHHMLDNKYQRQHIDIPNNIILDK